MEVVTDFIKENDGTCLYVIFGLQCAFVFIGFPFMLCKCSNAQKRHNLGYMSWMLKMMMLMIVCKWMLDSYEMVEI